MQTRTTDLVHGLLDRAAERRPTATAVRDESGGWTYAQLQEASRRAGSWLRQRGLARGDRVLVSLPNCRQLVALLFGALRVGVVVVPVGAQARPYQLAAVIGDAAPQLLVIDRLDRLAEIADAMPAQRVADLGELAAEASPTGRPDETRVGQDEATPDDIALLIYTSGSTDGPKGVVCRHQQVAFAVAAIAARLGYRSDDVVCARLPFSFDYSLYQAFLCAEAGAELVLVAGTDELSAFRLLRASGATVLPVVPPIAQSLLRLAARDATGFRLRLITNTGAELTRRVADALRATFPGARVVSMYGMTESKRITIADPDEDLRKPGTVGRPLPGTQVAVVGDDGEPLPVGQIGEIVVRGPHVMDGYWRDPQASAERFRPDPTTGEPCLFTGDYGKLAADGGLTLFGRRDSIFKRRGVRVSLNEIEAAALDIVEVEEAAAVLVGPERQCVLWVCGSLTPEQVRKGISERLGPAHIPDQCRQTQSLPRTPNGKIDRQQLIASAGK